MSVTDHISRHLPLLRRYARALTGSQAAGDAYVRATLEAALADDHLRDDIVRSRVRLYSAFTRIWSSALVENAEVATGLEPQEKAVQSRLAAITPEHRQALLLTTLEGFSTEETAAVLKIDIAEVEALVAKAIEEINCDAPIEVLIIEDEPLIALQLKEIVTDMGHTVIGSASTHKHAVELFGQRRADLVLADIQLADGSSGIEAVEELRSFGDVPVIFVTAFPERLLTGERPEPTYLVSKPFQEDSVRAAIGQSLFIGPTGGLVK